MKERLSGRRLRVRGHADPQPYGGGAALRGSSRKAISPAGASSTTAPPVLPWSPQAQGAD